MPFLLEPGPHGLRFGHSVARLTLRAGTAVDVCIVVVFAALPRGSAATESRTRTAAPIRPRRDEDGAAAQRGRAQMFAVDIFLLRLSVQGWTQGDGRAIDNFPCHTSAVPGPPNPTGVSARGNFAVAGRLWVRA